MFAAFSLRTESVTLICIYGDCNAILPFTSGKINARAECGGLTADTLLNENTLCK